METGDIRAVAFDLDGTLTQHKTPLGPENRRVLDALSRRYRLLIAGAGSCRRIFRQTGGYPMDIIGNYGMQQARYDADRGTLVFVRDDCIPCDRGSVEARIDSLRRKHGYTRYAGESVEFHPSGCVTFPLLGTGADLEDKLRFDPDRRKRSAIYEDVKAVFPDFNVVIGGSSSFDMAPFPYSKYLALDRFCQENGLLHRQLLYAGDDWGPGGNDEAVFRSDFPCVPVDDYTRLEETLRQVLDF